MPEQIYPPGAPNPPVFLTMTPTTTATQIDSSGQPCVGLNCQVPKYDDSGVVVNAYVYAVDGAAKLGVEIAPGEKVFIACSNTNQLKFKLISGAGGTTAFLRAEVIKSNAPNAL